MDIQEQVIRAANLMDADLEEKTAQGEEHTYPTAGEDAQPEVKEAIERFRKLSPEERSKQPLLYWLLGEGTPDLKISQKDAEYVDKSEKEGQTCGNCEYIYKAGMKGERYICSQITGDIKPAGWCKYWEAE